MKGWAYHIYVSLFFYIYFRFSIKAATSTILQRRMENGFGTGLYLDGGGGDSLDKIGDLERETSKIEQEALDRKIKLGKANEFILSVINNCARTGAKFLDLSKKNLSSIPEELLTLTHVEVGTTK